MSGARQALSINKLESYNPPATIKDINNQLNELRKKYREKISYFNEKYAAIEGKNEELKGIDNDEFEQDLMEMKSLVKASKELTEVLKDVSKVNIEMDSKEESTSIEIASLQQMLISVCGSVESFLKDDE